MFKNIQFFGLVLTLLTGIPGIAENTKSKLEAETTQAIRAVAHGETYLRTRVDVGGTFPIVEQQTEFEKGVTNIDKGRVSQAQQVNFITFGYEKALTSDSKKPQDLLYREDLPATFNSASLIIKQGKELVRIPIASLALLGTHNPNERWYMLDVPMMLNNTEEIDVSIEFAQGASGVASNDEFIYLALRGPRTNV
jgi:hypothetical protein